MRISDSAGYFSFVRKTKEGIVLPYRESYAVLNGSPGSYMTRWSISADGTLFWTNGENVYKCDWSGTGSKLIYHDLHWILEFGDNLYVVYNPSVNIVLCQLLVIQIKRVRL